MIDQITVFLPNRPGSLADMSAILGKHDVQVIALMVADSTDFGIVRIIVDKPQVALDAFAEAGLHAATTKVVAMEIPNVPGGLGSVIRELSSADLSIQYAYSCSVGGRAVDIVSVSGDPVQVKLGQFGIPDLRLEDLT